MRLTSTVKSQNDELVKLQNNLKSSTVSNAVNEASKNISDFVIQLKQSNKSAKVHKPVQPAICAHEDKGEAMIADSQSSYSEILEALKEDDVIANSSQNKQQRSQFTINNDHHQVSDNDGDHLSNNLQEEYQQGQEEGDKGADGFALMMTCPANGSTTNNTILDLMSPQTPTSGHHFSMLAKEDVDKTPSLKHHSSTAGYDDNNPQKVDNDGIEVVDLSEQVENTSPIIKYEEVVRNKAARKQMHASDCPCCSGVLLTSI
jgi:hypothetical protein